jgi:hypothetical protein
VRDGEDDKFWFRCDRFFSTENQWYFTTREQLDAGPFVTREAAEHGLELFIDSISNQHAEIDYAISIALQGEWAIAKYQ